MLVYHPTFYMNSVMLHSDSASDDDDAADDTAEQHTSSSSSSSSSRKTPPRNCSDAIVAASDTGAPAPAL